MKRKHFLLKQLGNDHGSMLIISYFVIVILVGLGAALSMLAVNEGKVSERQRLTTVAFNIAEAGLERGLYDLRRDFVGATGTPSWADGDINGMTAGPNTGSYYALPYANPSINGGSYTVSLLNVAGQDDVWIQSVGTINDITHTIVAYVRMVDISPWGNAIFAGKGASGTMINGIVDIRGSVHILGNDLNPGDFAVDMGGTAELVGNNYSSMPAVLQALVPTLPLVNYNGEMVESLSAELRVKNGIVGLSGSSTVGESDVSGNSVKETVDGVYVTDGWGGNQGAINVNSDNGTASAYDLGDAIAFPSLSDPYMGYATYQEYLRDHALVLTTELANIKPNSTFSYSDANGSISMDGSGNLTIDGIIYVDGGNDILFTKHTADVTITYSGTGSILCTGNINIQTNLITSGASSFPTNIIGFMTPNSMNIDAAGLDVMGLFYAEDTMAVSKQTDLVGTIVSNYFDMGLNVPAVFQVPETVNNMPPGMIGSNAKWYMVVAWIKS